MRRATSQRSIFAVTQTSKALLSDRRFACAHSSCRYGPFTHDAWTHPETLQILSSIAGVELTPAIDYELGSINFSVKSDQQARDELDTIERQKQFFAEDEGIAGCPWEDDKPVVGWHKDSYPFVCVLMLSDCKNMVGGETALCSADGKTILKIRGPEMVCAGHPQAQSHWLI